MGKVRRILYRRIYRLQEPRRNIAGSSFHPASSTGNRKGVMGDACKNGKHYFVRSQYGKKIVWVCSQCGEVRYNG